MCRELKVLKGLDLDFLREHKESEIVSMKAKGMGKCDIMCDWHDKMMKSFVKSIRIQ